MLEDEQRRYKANPFNILRGYTDGLLKINQTYCVVAVGSCELINDAAIVLVGGEPLLSLSIVDQRLAVSVVLYDDQDRLMLLIQDNEWITGDPAVWDLEAAHQRLVIRKRPGDIRLSIDATEEPIKLNASLRRSGHRIDFKPRGIEVNGVVNNFGIIDMGIVAMRIVVDTSTGIAALERDPRYGKGMFVSRPDRLTRIIEGVQILQRFREETTV